MSEQPTALPEDLSASAVQAARRMHRLPYGRLHVMVLFKLSKSWFLSVLTGEGIKIEQLRRGEGEPQVEGLNGEEAG
jgi:hypothetical protein